MKLWGISPRKIHIMRNEKIKELANDNVIEKIIVLDMEKKGQIKEVR